MAIIHRWQDYIDGTPNMGSKRFDTERSEVENLVCMYVGTSLGAGWSYLLSREERRGEATDNYIVYILTSPPSCVG